MTKLNSPSYRNALKSMKSQTHALKRTNSLLTRVLTRIYLISVYLNSDNLEDKELKSKVSLLSSLLEVKKKLKAEIKELSQDSNKTEDLFDNL